MTVAVIASKGLTKSEQFLRALQLPVSDRSEDYPPMAAMRLAIHVI